MKKKYIVPSTRITPFKIEAILHSISNNTINGGSDNGSSTASGSDGGFGDGGEKEVSPSDFAKGRMGFYSSYCNDF